MKSILDRSFQYTPSAQTDLKKTFARIRREQRAQDAANDRAAAEASLKVATLRPAASASAR
jgi:hypothetical protein